jgi:hypothetical protein
MNDEDRFLVHKDGLDYGPFNLLQLRAALDQGTFDGRHVLVDRDTGASTPLAEHPLVADYVAEAERRLSTLDRLRDEAKATRTARRLTIAITVGILAILAAGGNIWWRWWRPREVIDAGDGTRPRDVDEIEVRFGGSIDTRRGTSVDTPTSAKPSGKKGARQPKGRHPQNAGVSGPTELGDASQAGGDETIAQEQIQRTLMANFSKLKSCVIAEHGRNPTLRGVKIDFVVQVNGRVKGVAANGREAGPLVDCLFERMQQLAFPTSGGMATHASFELHLR